jgi:hypothetical protein
LLGGAVVAWPVVTRAQNDRRMRRTGILTTYPESHPVAQSNFAVFRETLAVVPAWSGSESQDL